VNSFFRRGFTLRTRITCVPLNVREDLCKMSDDRVPETSCPVFGALGGHSYNHYGGQNVCSSCRNFFRRSGTRQRVIKVGRLGFVYIHEIWMTVFHCICTYIVCTILYMQLYNTYIQFWYMQLYNTYLQFWYMQLYNTYLQYMHTYNFGTHNCTIHLYRQFWHKQLYKHSTYNTYLQFYIQFWLCIHKIGMTVLLFHTALITTFTDFCFSTKASGILLINNVFIILGHKLLYFRSNSFWHSLLATSHR
jgi:hypothetical protein